MPTKLERLNSVTTSVAATNSASTSPKIPFGACSGGMVFVTAVSGATSIAWYAASGVGETPLPVYADGSALTTSITVSNAYALPDGLFGAPFIVAVTNSGTATFTISVKG